MRVDVLMLSAAHPPDDVRIVRKEGAALAAAGWRVVHLCPGARRAPESPGVRPAPGKPGANLAPGYPGAPDAPDVIEGVLIGTYSRRPGWWGRLRNIPRLAGLARLMRPRVIHAHEPDAWLAALLARCAPVVLDVHEHYPSRLDARLPAPLRGLARLVLRRICRSLARRADAVIVAKDGLARDYGRDCVAVRNYAEAPLVPPRSHRAGPVTLLHLGAISRARGWPQLLAALALGDCGLTIAGRFTDGSEAEFLAAAAPFGPRIRFLGWLPPAEMAAVAASCDINLVLFQPGEENHRLALPHKLADGMLAGLPVIAPAFATEVADMVEDAGCGLLVDVTDPTAIAAAVATLADPALRARLGAAGRHAALGRYAWAGQAAALVGLYQRLLCSPDGGPFSTPCSATRRAGFC